MHYLFLCLMLFAGSVQAVNKQLQQELINDPLLLGYGCTDVVPLTCTLTDQQIADVLNTADILAPHETTTPAILYEALNVGEVSALNVQNRGKYDIAISPLFNLDGFNARGAIEGHIKDIFGAGSQTYQAYILATQGLVSRASQLGFSSVSAQMVGLARTGGY